MYNQSVKLYLIRAHLTYWLQIEYWRVNTIYQIANKCQWRKSYISITCTAPNRTNYLHWRALCVFFTMSAQTLEFFNFEHWLLHGNYWLKPVQKWVCLKPVIEHWTLYSSRVLLEKRKYIQNFVYRPLKLNIVYDSSIVQQRTLLQTNDR